MGRGSFEDIVSKKFQGVEPEISDGVWGNIENSLNSDLVAKYQASKGWYRWLTAAAILIAISSFAIHYTGINNYKDSVSGGTYNALLSDGFKFKSNARENFNISSNAFNWRPIVVAQRTLSQNQKGDDSDLENIYLDDANQVAIVHLDKKSPTIELANEDHNVAVYHSVLGRTTIRKQSKNKFWAGVEAGAGKYSPSFSGTNSITNSVASSNVASALGANDFVNPSTSATQNSMNEGVATSLGFDFGLKLGKKWTLESGLAYTNINNSSTASINVLDNFTTKDKANVGVGTQELKDTPIISGERTINETSSIQSEIDLNNNVQFASMPLKAGYYLLDSKFSLRLNAGFSANYLIENSLSDPSNEIVRSSQVGLYNDWSFDGIGGIEFGYTLFNKVDLTIEPNYRHSITPLSNSINTPSQFVIQTGFRYTLK